ncbi:MAG: Inter-alpha-trypsin inhibitor domain protein [Labilithrix sp.]|nr:Inter-alpha-trypsin inhibitor domain protein [Labilithrix sp.]
MTLAWTPAPSSSSPYRMQDVRSQDEASHRGAELLTPDGRSLPLVSAKLRVSAGGGLARVVLEQTFENPYDDTLRVTYKMPLPVDGAVSGYAFRIGERTIQGRVDRKEAARARFEQAIVQGKTAALLEQEKADTFTQEIGNIPPRRTIVAEITIDQRLAWQPEGEWELRFPTVIGPRYIGANVSAEDRRASHVELADGSVRGRVHLEVRIADTVSEGRRAESPSHSLHARPDGVIELSDLAGGRLDRDVVVRWAVAKRDVGLSVQVARPAAGSTNGRNAYALLSIVPPAADAGYATVPRDLIVLLDTSGSMAGGPLEQGKRVVAALIDSLSEYDRLEVVEFSNRANRYTRSPVPGTAREKQKAIHWVMARQASGGTEMHSAIVDALHGLRPGAQRQVVLVTDGYVGGEEQIVTLLHESLPASCRMHVVGVGSGVNRTLAASLARAGRGAELLVGLEEDAERCARNLVDKTRAPVLTDLMLAGDALVDHAPEHMPDVFAGAPVLAALQVRPSGGEIIVRGNLARGVWEQRIQVPAADPGEGNEAIVKLYGRERVADLEMRWTMGNEVQAIDREIESIGLVFQIATRRTSWVAIDDDRSVDPRRGSRHEEIPQELPYGTTMASFGAPIAAPASSSVMALAAPAMSAPPMYRAMAAMPRTMVRSAAPPRSLDADDFGADEPGEDESTMAARAVITPYPGAPRSEEPATLRPPPPAPRGAAFHQPPPPQMIRKEEGASFGMIAQQPLAPKRKSTWLVLLIAALVAMVVVLAAILGWILLTR